MQVKLYQILKEDVLSPENPVHVYSEVFNEKNIRECWKGQDCGDLDFYKLKDVCLTGILKEVKDISEVTNIDYYPFLADTLNLPDIYDCLEIKHFFQVT